MKLERMKLRLLLFELGRCYLTGDSESNESGPIVVPTFMRNQIALRSTFPPLIPSFLSLVTVEKGGGGRRGSYYTCLWGYLREVAAVSICLSAFVFCPKSCCRSDTILSLFLSLATFVDNWDTLPDIELSLHTQQQQVEKAPRKGQKRPRTEVTFLQAAF